MRFSFNNSLTTKQKCASLTVTYKISIFIIFHCIYILQWIAFSLEYKLVVQWTRSVTCSQKFYLNQKRSEALKTNVGLWLQLHVCTIHRYKTFISHSYFISKPFCLNFNWLRYEQTYIKASDKYYWLWIVYTKNKMK